MLPVICYSTSKHPPSHSLTHTLTVSVLALPQSLHLLYSFILLLSNHLGAVKFVSLHSGIIFYHSLFLFIETFRTFFVYCKFPYITILACTWLTPHPCLLSSFREVEEELEVVWQAATRENQQMRETLFDTKLIASLNSWPPDEATTSTRHQPHSSGPLLFTSHQSPGVQRKAIFKSDSDHQNNSLDEKHKNGLDFYC